MSEMRLLLFGDGALVSKGRLLTQVLASRADPILSLLFQRSSDALRREISQLAPAEREQIPVFNSIDELIERLSPNCTHPGVQNALLCVSQLAHYIE